MSGAHCTILSLSPSLPLSLKVVPVPLPQADPDAAIEVNTRYFVPPCSVNPPRPPVPDLECGTRAVLQLLGGGEGGGRPRIQLGPPTAPAVAPPPPPPAQSPAGEPSALVGACKTYPDSILAMVYCLLWLQSLPTFSNHPPSRSQTAAARRSGSRPPARLALTWSASAAAPGQASRRWRPA